MALIINFDNLQYVSPAAFGEADTVSAIVEGWDGTKTALCILLADGNGRGGGDLCSDDKIVGSWAGSRIGIVDDKIINDEFSLPGQKGIPLQEQYLKAGVDVSDRVMAALREGEGDSFTAGVLLNYCRVSKQAQRDLWCLYGSSSVLKMVANDTPIPSYHAFLALLGTTPRLAHSKTVKALEAGINRLAAELAVPVGYRVLRLGRVLQADSISKVTLRIQLPSGEEKSLCVKLSDGQTVDATTPSQVFETVFGLDSIMRPRHELSDHEAAKVFVADLLKNVTGE